VFSTVGSLPIKRAIYDFGRRPESVAEAIMAEPGLAAFRDLTLVV
jgi:hypothetical protein